MNKKALGLAGVAGTLTLTLAVGTASAGTGAPPNANNCYGVNQSTAVAGPGGNPGTTNGAVTSSFAQQPSPSGQGNGVSDFQQTSRQSASCGTTGAP